MGWFVSKVVRNKQTNKPTKLRLINGGKNKITTLEKEEEVYLFCLFFTNGALHPL
jgi:hypothetical protein